MKNLTKYLGIIVLAAAGFGMTACMDLNPVDKNNGDNDNFSLATLKTPNGVKSVYLSDIAVTSSTRAAADGNSISSLSYITSTGQNAPILFSTPSGKKQFIFDVTGVEQLGERCIIITITGFYEVTGTGAAGSYTVGPKVNTGWESSLWDEKTQTSVIIPKIDSVLIDMKNSKLYDFSEFQPRYSGSPLPRFMEGNIIYTVIRWSSSENKDVDTVYKIDLSTASVDSALQAVPLNNSTLMPIRYIQLPYTINNKLLGNKQSYNYDRMCLDVLGAIQPEEFKEPILPENNKKVDIFSLNKLVRDLTGKPWTFINYYNNTSYNNEYVTAEVSIDASGQCILNSEKDVQLSFDISDSGQIFTFNTAGVGNAIKNNIYNFYTYYNNNGVVTLYSNGFIRLRPEVDGIKVESVEITITSTPTSLAGKSIISSEDYLFWLENKTIKRQKLAAGSSAQNVYSNPGIADNFATRDLLTASGRKLIFYQYTTATEVHTYSLDMYNPNAQPELLATNDAEIRSIVELDF